MTPRARVLRVMGWVALFAAAFALVEASVVVYLRAIYYPAGFVFPLHLIGPEHLRVEIAREAATIVMLAAVAMAAGRGGWERFGHFLVAFGVWDIMYYGWLRVFLGWPATLNDWDILFLIPVPWIGPVIAPIAVAALMTLCGGILVARVAGGGFFRPRWRTWSAAAGATAVLLWTFMADTAATLHGAPPAPYRYDLLVGSLIFFAIAFLTACRSPKSTA